MFASVSVTLLIECLSFPHQQLIKAVPTALSFSCKLTLLSIFISLLNYIKSISIIELQSSSAFWAVLLELGNVAIILIKIYFYQASISLTNVLSNYSFNRYKRKSMSSLISLKSEITSTSSSHTRGFCTICFVWAFEYSTTMSIS